MEHVSIACSQEVGSVLETEASPFSLGNVKGVGRMKSSFCAGTWKVQGEFSRNIWAGLGIPG